MLTEEFNAEIEKFKQAYSKGYLLMTKHAPHFTSGLDNLLRLLDSKYYDIRNQLQQAQDTISRYKIQEEELKRKVTLAKTEASKEYPRLVAARFLRERKTRLNLGEANVFGCILNCPKPPIVSELAKLCNMRITTVHGIVNRLELKRLITTRKQGRTKLCILRKSKGTNNTSNVIPAITDKILDGTSKEGGSG